MELEGVKCQMSFRTIKLLSFISKERSDYLPLTPFNSIKTLTPHKLHLHFLSLVCLQPVGSPAIVGTQRHLHGVGALHGLDDDLLHPLALVGVDAEVEFIVHL